VSKDSVQDVVSMVSVVVVSVRVSGHHDGGSGLHVHGLRGLHVHRLLSIHLRRRRLRVAGLLICNTSVSSA
jgi:hypothetical protein